LNEIRILAHAAGFVVDSDHIGISVVKFDLVLPDHSAIFHPGWCRTAQVDVKNPFKGNGTSFTQFVRKRGLVPVDPEMLQSREYRIFLFRQCPG
jgi:hypothetical protein